MKYTVPRPYDHIMNFDFPYYWAVSTLPTTARDPKTDKLVDLSIPIRPCVLLLPISEGRTVERSFPGGTVYCLFDWLYDFYHEPVEAIDITYLIPRTEGAEQERLLQCLTRQKIGCLLCRLDLLDPQDPSFLGIDEGLVILGS